MKTKPWLNEDGSKKTDKEIKVCSKEWTTSTWEEYLDTTFKYKLREDYSADHNVEEISNEKYQQYYVDKIAKPDQFKHLAARFRRLMRDLTGIQREVIKDIFWNDKTYSQVSKEQKMSKSTVHYHVQNALKKLKEGMLEVHILHSQPKKLKAEDLFEFESFSKKVSLNSEG